MDLIEQLFLDSCRTYKSAGVWQLGDDGAAVAGSLGDWIAAAREVRHVLEARVDEVSAGDLHAAFHQVADQRAGAHLVGIVQVPTKPMHEWRHEHGGVGEP